MESLRHALGDELMGEFEVGYKDLGLDPEAALRGAIRHFVRVTKRLGWRVKVGRLYVQRRGDLVDAFKERPPCISKTNAMRLMADFIEAEDERFIKSAVLTMPRKPRLIHVSRR